RPLDVMALLIPIAALADPQRDDGRPDAIIGRGRMLIPMLASALSPDFAPATVTRALGAGSVAAIAARALGLDDAVAPMLDAALVAALGAPPAAASGLFAIARAAGWLAHTLEQRAAGVLLRPRARYTGAPVTP